MEEEASRTSAGGEHASCKWSGEEERFSPVQVDRGRRRADTSVSFSLASIGRFILRRDRVAVARESSLLYTDNVLVEARAESESNASFDRFSQCLWCIPTLK